MEIRNITQFATFVSSNDLTKLDTAILQVVLCLNGYVAACDCYKKEDKLNMYAVCNKAYAHVVRHVIPKLRNEFLSKTGERSISFYNDQNILIGVVSR